MMDTNLLPSMKSIVNVYLLQDLMHMHIYHNHKSTCRLRISINSLIPSLGQYIPNPPYLSPTATTTSFRLNLCPTSTSIKHPSYPS